MIRIILLACLFFFAIQLDAQELEHSFEVTFKGKSIGNLFAQEKSTETTVIKDLRTNTEVDMIALSVHVESEVKILKKQEKLIQSTSYRHANRGTEEILAHIKKIGPKEYQVKRNGKEFKIENEEITYCTVDLYFAEPVKINAVFSSMYAEFLKIEEVSPHRYKLSSPKSKDTYYTYQKGKLIKVEIDTPLGMVICNKIS